LFEDARFKQHARTVIGMVDTAVQLLEQGDMVTLIGALRQLGARHHKYNIDQRHYPVVGKALMETDVNEDWGKVTTLIFTTMMTTW
jgi:hemoglobin-like flavoprotein